MAFLRKRTSKGIAYYSIVESYRESGTQKVKQRVILNIGNEAELMKFTMEQYSSNQGVPKDICFKAYAHGAGMALFWSAEMVGIEKMMDQVFPPKNIGGVPRSRILLLGMIHRVISPGSKRSFEAWSEQTSLPYHLGFDPGTMTSQAFWEAMDGISVHQIYDVWNLLMDRLFEMLDVNVRKFHLDYTNFFTFIDTKNCRCYICSLGHNKQKRNDLRQFCLAVITSSELLVPIVWEIYDGKDNDTTEFPKFIERIKKSMARLGIPFDEITITFDGGSNSQDNFAGLGCHFICAHTLAGNKDLYEIDLDRYETVILENERERLAYRIDGETFSGVCCTGILTFSQALKDGQVEAMEKDIKAAREACDEMNSRIQNPRSKLYRDLKKAEENCRRDRQDAIQYNIEIEEEWKQRQAEGKRGGRKKKPRSIPVWDENSALREIACKYIFSKGYLRDFCFVTLVVETNRRYFLFCVDQKKKDAYCRKYYGKKLTITDHTDWTTQQILKEYCNQECIENDIFKVSKDPDYFHVRPQYHWTDDKIWMHVFICLGAMSLGELLYVKLKGEGIDLSKKKMLTELNNIKDGWMYKGGKKVDRRMEHLDSDQEKLWNAVLSIFAKESA